MQNNIEKTEIVGLWLSVSSAIYGAQFCGHSIQ
jgi:hypothetical protein